MKTLSTLIGSVAAGYSAGPLLGAAVGYAATQWLLWAGCVAVVAAWLRLEYRDYHGGAS